jgi:LmeA-like phospholipid-binding
VLAIVFVVGDQVARSYAQNTIASKIKSDGFPVKPTVRIKGFPFLTQVADHDVRTVDLSASNVPEGKLDISSITATASGVHLNSSFNSATIDAIHGTAVVTFSSVANALGVHGITIAPDPSAGPNMAKVSIGPLNAVGQISLTSPTKLEVQLHSLDGIPTSAIGLQPDYTITLPSLPLGIEISGVSLTAQGLSFPLSAHNTTLSQ